MCKAVLICALMEHARIQKLFSGRGVGGFPIFQKGSDGKFQHGKNNNLAIPGGGGSRYPPPLDPPMWKEWVFSLHFLSTNVQLCTPYPLQMAAVQENALSGCIYTLKNVHDQTA